MKASTCARSRTCGPITTPSTSSTTTTGTNRPRAPTTADSVPAIAAVATIARNEPASTLNAVTPKRAPVIEATFALRRVTAAHTTRVIRAARRRAAAGARWSAARSRQARRGRAPRAAWRQSISASIASATWLS